MEQDNHWTLDRRVPVALILTMALQIATAVWWASSMNSRMNALEAMGQQQQQRINDVERQTQALQVGAATVVAQLTALNDGQREIKATLQQINEYLRTVERARE